jgi:hypothetical protein
MANEYSKKTRNSNLLWEKMKSIGEWKAFWDLSIDLRDWTGNGYHLTLPPLVANRPAKLNGSGYLFTTATGLNAPTYPDAGYGQSIWFSFKPFSYTPGGSLYGANDLPEYAMVISGEFYINVGFVGEIAGTQVNPATGKIVNVVSTLLYYPVDGTPGTIYSKFNRNATYTAGQVASTAGWRSLSASYIGGRIAGGAYTGSFNGVINACGILNKQPSDYEGNLMNLWAKTKFE